MKKFILITMSSLLLISLLFVNSIDTDASSISSKKINLTTVENNQPTSISCWGDSMIQGIGSDERIIFINNEELDISYCTAPSVIESMTGISTNNFGIGGQLSNEITDRAINYYQKNDSDILILEMGSNGGWDNDYDVLIFQYKKIIEQANTDKYLIVGDTDDPGTSIADLTQEPIDNNIDETSWEKALEEAFGDHFLNLRLYILNNGLEDNGLKLTEEDISNINNGIISKQLRADWTHFNAFGYYSKGKAIYEKGKSLNFWS